MWLGVYVDMVPLPLLVAPERWRGPPPNLNEVPARPVPSVDQFINEPSDSQEHDRGAHRQPPE